VCVCVCMHAWMNNFIDSMVIQGVTANMYTSALVVTVET